MVNPGGSIENYSIQGVTLTLTGTQLIKVVLNVNYRFWRGGTFKTFNVSETCSTSPNSLTFGASTYQLTCGLTTNKPPVANAGLDQIVEQQDPAGSSVTLDGSGSTDPDNDPLTFSWTGPFGTATGEFPNVTLPAGTHSITLIVNDGTEDSTPDTVQITVQDTTPPQITILTDVTANATGPLTVVDLGTPVATDAVGVVSLTNDAPTGGFPVDSTNTVTWTACDAAGNCSTATQTVTVKPFDLGVSIGKTKLKIHRGDGDKDKDKDRDRGPRDWLQIAGTFTEFSNGDGLNWLTDPVTIVLNGFTWNLPPGSFTLKKGDGDKDKDGDRGLTYKYKGGRTGLTEVKVDENGKFKLKVKRMDLSGLSFGTPIPFAVTIGNDFGESNVTFNTRRGKDDDKD